MAVVVAMGHLVVFAMSATALDTARLSDPFLDVKRPADQDTYDAYVRNSIVRVFLGSSSDAGSLCLFSIMDNRIGFEVRSSWTFTFFSVGRNNTSKYTTANITCATRYERNRHKLNVRP